MALLSEVPESFGDGRFGSIVQQQKYKSEAISLLLVSLLLLIISPTLTNSWLSCKRQGVAVSLLMGLLLTMTDYFIDIFFPIFNTVNAGGKNVLCAILLSAARWGSVVANEGDICMPNPNDMERHTYYCYASC